MAVANDDPAADRIDQVDFEPVNDNVLEKFEKLPDDPDKPKTPDITSEDWQEYVMNQFAENELDPSGNPTVVGLRRVAQKIIGRIVVSDCQPVSFPTSREISATVKCTVTFERRDAVSYTEDGAYVNRVTFSGVADCYSGNTDSVYARFPSAMAETRAEGRALRKALNLKNVSAEETTLMPEEEAGLDGKITAGQKRMLGTKCSMLDINVVKFINMGKSKFSSIDDVPYNVADNMIMHLTDIQRGVKECPAAVSGYDNSWQKEKEAK